MMYYKILALTTVRWPLVQIAFLVAWLAFCTVGATAEERYAFFHPENPFSHMDFKERLHHYADIGRNLDPHKPDSVLSRGAYEG